MGDCDDCGSVPFDFSHSESSAVSIFLNGSTEIGK